MLISVAIPISFGLISFAMFVSPVFRLDHVLFPETPPRARIRRGIRQVMAWKVMQLARDCATSLDAILSVLRECERIRVGAPQSKTWMAKRSSTITWAKRSIAPDTVEGVLGLGPFRHVRLAKPGPLVVLALRTSTQRLQRRSPIVPPQARRRLRRICAERGLEPVIDVDGGENVTTVARAAAAGATAIVARSAIFGSED